MTFEVLPGPSLAELARTAIARATAATIVSTEAGRPGRANVPMIADTSGRPVIEPPPGSVLARQLAARPTLVTVAVPAQAPHSTLWVAGRARACGPLVPGAEPTRYRVTPLAIKFTGTALTPVRLAQYQAAEPDPLWREAPGILRHLEECHQAELSACIRAHGLPEAECVVPCGLDRFGLELMVLTPDGTDACRLSFPSGPVTALDQVPASLRAALTCHCADPSGQPRTGAS